MSSPRAGFRTYRYGLKESNHLRRDDGVIVLESLDAGRTLYTEYDFFDADWGVAKIWVTIKSGGIASKASIKRTSRSRSARSCRLARRARTQDFARARGGVDQIV